MNIICKTKKEAERYWVAKNIINEGDIDELFIEIKIQGNTFILEEINSPIIKEVIKRFFAYLENVFKWFLPL